MNKIAPELIDEIAISLNQLEHSEFEQLIKTLGEEQPAVLNYILSEDFEALGEEEHQLLIVDTIMIWKIIAQTINHSILPDDETIDNYQFENWRLAENLSTTKGQIFEDYVEPLIADYPQDELLYFVIDTFSAHEEDHSAMNKESKLSIFIALKSLCDTWLNL